MYVYHNMENEPIINVRKFYRRQQLIQQLKHRFMTFGYKEINTPTFEAYDLYSKMNGTVNHHEMIKTIDNTGQVLVLRPDITIPITQKIAQHTNQLQQDLRYFYILNVFRQTAESNDQRESTQAGVEYFGNPDPEADGEIIALASQILQDLHIPHFTIEIGHAGFFKQLIKEMNLKQEDLELLKSSIQAKNVTEMEHLLNGLSIDPTLQRIATSLPFLYGKPAKVLQKVKELPLSKALRATLENITSIFNILAAYHVEKNIVLDLSLINHMDYYSDMIFQGFIEKIGKPVLMGGRYDRLADQFSANIPAIGFAFDIDLLISGVPTEQFFGNSQIDVLIYYEHPFEKDSLSLARKLRENNFSVVTYPTSKQESQLPKTIYVLRMGTEWTFEKSGKQLQCSSIEDFFALLENRES